MRHLRRASPESELSGILIESVRESSPQVSLRNDPFRSESVSQTEQAPNELPQAWGNHPSTKQMALSIIDLTRDEADSKAIQTPSLPEASPRVFSRLSDCNPPETDIDNTGQDADELKKALAMSLECPRLEYPRAGNRGIQIREPADTPCTTAGPCDISPTTSGCTAPAGLYPGTRNVEAWEAALLFSNAYAEGLETPNLQPPLWPRRVNSERVWAETSSGVFELGQVVGRTRFCWKVKIGSGRGGETLPVPFKKVVRHYEVGGTAAWWSPSERYEPVEVRSYEVVRAAEPDRGKAWAAQSPCDSTASSQRAGSTDSRAPSGPGVVYLVQLQDGTTLELGGAALLPVSCQHLSSCSDGEPLQGTGPLEWVLQFSALTGYPSHFEARPRQGYTSTLYGDQGEASTSSGNLSGEDAPAAPACELKRKQRLVRADSESGDTRGPGSSSNTRGVPRRKVRTRRSEDPSAAPKSVNGALLLKRKSSGLLDPDRPAEALPSQDGSLKRASAS
eukprot:jgi/Botrbrau1/16998/Bobra.49_2s0057.1